MQVEYNEIESFSEVPYEMSHGTELLGKKLRVTLQCLNIYHGKFEN